jgi:hypothetical protein
MPVTGARCTEPTFHAEQRPIPGSEKNHYRYLSRPPGELGGGVQGLGRLRTVCAGARCRVHRARFRPPTLYLVRKLGRRQRRALPLFASSQKSPAHNYKQLRFEPLKPFVGVQHKPVVV